MSFLNPVNEPVTVFRSTDEGAPQLLQNARAAGDYLAVITACLTNGYGTKASAGWAMTGISAGVTEFVPPSISVGYRFRVSDTAAASFVIGGYKGESNTAVLSVTHTKSWSTIERSDPRNGWIMIVCDRGFWFIEHVISFYYKPDTMLSRLTYFGGVKSATDDGDTPFSFWTVGYDAPVGTLPSTFIGNDYPQHRVQIAEGVRGILMGTIFTVPEKSSFYGTNNQIGLISPLYIYNGPKLIAQHSGMYCKLPIDTDQLNATKDVVIDGRTMVQTGVTYRRTNEADIRNNANLYLIPTDYWEY